MGNSPPICSELWGEGCTTACKHEFSVCCSRPAGRFKDSINSGPGADRVVCQDPLQTPQVAKAPRPRLSPAPSLIAVASLRIAPAPSLTSSHIFLLHPVIHRPWRTFSPLMGRNSPKEMLQIICQDNCLKRSLEENSTNPVF